MLTPVLLDHTVWICGGCGACLYCLYELAVDGEWVRRRWEWAVKSAGENLPLGSI